jgi:hypothetical protein
MTSITEPFRRLRVVSVFAAGLMIATSASRADAQATDSSGWKFELAPYVWAAGMNGTVSINDRPQSGLAVDQSFSDILEVLAFALMGSFEARKGRWGGMVDGVYFRIEDEGTVTGRRGFASLSASAELAQKMYSFAGVYRAGQGPSPIDVLGGLRYAAIESTVDIALSVPPVLARERTFSETKSWVDPYIGVRIDQELGKRWSVNGYADVGGFTIGSDLTMQGLANVRFAFTPSILGSLGYRVVSTDYDKDGFQYDMVNAGAVLGVAFRW